MRTTPLPRRRTRTRLLGVAALGAAGVLALAACGSSGSKPSAGSAAGSGSASGKALAGASCSSSNATKLTFWAWVPGMNRAVNEFNKTHHNICVTLQNPGAGSGEYVPLDNALKAGSGAPDVAEIEFDLLPSYEIQHYLVDLSKYGANKYKDKFSPWAWQQVSQGSKVYSMPSDFGPVGFYYNAPLLQKYHITPPTTWAKFTDAATKLHQANPKVYLVNFAPDDLQYVMELMAQAGALPFKWSGGSSITINWTGPAQMRFADYWQNLIDKHLVTTTNAASNQLPTNMDKGVVAAAIYSAWAPSYFAPNAKNSMGNWRAAPMPTWGSGMTTDWGGSTYPVFNQSAHPAQAAQFSEWLTATDASWNIVKTPPSSLFPTYLPLLNSPSFEKLTYPISGKSHPNKVFAASAKHMAPIEWPPFMTEALTQAATTFGKVENGNTTLPAAFKTFQSQMVSYAKQQGFTVSTS